METPAARIARLAESALETLGGTVVDESAETLGLGPDLRTIRRDLRLLADLARDATRS